MKSKYHNKKVVLPDGTVFDSQKEYARWCELRLLERAGEITNLQRQVPFEVIPPYTEVIERYGKKGQKLKDEVKTIEKATYYYADFTYYENGKLVVEDTKGLKVEPYPIKRKLMLQKFGIKIKET